MPIYAFGSNGSGQLGVGHAKDISAPTCCLFSPKEEGRGRVKRIVAGGNHTVILFDNGAAYAAGSTEHGRCGMVSASETASSTPLQRKFRRVILRRSDGCLVDAFRDVSATWAATFLASASGDKVFALGAGDKGELGLGAGFTETSSTESVMSVPGFPPRDTLVHSIASGMGHTVVVLSSGDVFGWGAARKGQLGQSAVPRKVVWSPEMVDGVPFKADRVACGREFTVISGIGWDGYRDYTILGSDKWGVISGAPPQALMTGESVSTSWHGVYVHEHDLSITAWGRNDRGQLPPPTLPRTSQIATGSEHVIASFPDQKTVVVFGWGEHGNCGPDTDAQGNVNGRWNTIPLPVDENAIVVGVGAGCATSWIVTSSPSDAG
jgi:protein ATS1